MFPIFKFYLLFRKKKKKKQESLARNLKIITSQEGEIARLI